MHVMPSKANQWLEKAERDPKKYGKVAVLMGGYAEYEISLQSGHEVLVALQNAGVDAHEVLVQPGKFVWSEFSRAEASPKSWAQGCVQHNHWLAHLIAEHFDRVFIALHGKVGEDGTVQGALEIIGLPYTGSKVCASAMAMHKLRTKQIWKALELPSLPYLDVTEHYNAEEIVQAFGLPLAVKASCSGSTFGVSKVKKVEDFLEAYQLAKKYDDTVIVEPWVNGIEYTVPILGSDPMPSIRIEPKSEFYDYAAKYVDDHTGFFCPSGLNDFDETHIRALALEAYHVLGCTDFGRVDFIRDNSGKFWLMEVNTIPGLTTHSLVPRSTKALGYTFTDLVLAILSMTFRR